jgi:hypothetical protein
VAVRDYMQCTNVGPTLDPFSTSTRGFSGPTSLGPHDVINTAFGA